MVLVAVLQVNTQIVKNGQYSPLISLYTNIFIAKQRFKESDYWKHLELKQISENYYEFEGIDKEGCKCNGTIQLQVVNE